MKTDKKQESNVSVLINQSDIDKLKGCVLNEDQLKYITDPTPASEIYEKVGKDSKRRKYVKGSYVKKVLNLMFGFGWDEQVVSTNYYPDLKQVTVVLRFVYKGNDGETYFKEQFGGADLEVSIGDAYKAAATDALKKCASELGLFSDVYGLDDLRTAPLTDDEKHQKIVEMCELLVKLDIKVVNSDHTFLQRVIENKEVKSYDKAIAQLQKKLPKS